MSSKNKRVAVVDDRNYPPFVILYVEEFLSAEVLSLSKAALLVWLALLNRAHRVNGERQYHYSYDALTATLGLSRASVGRGLAQLREKGLIVSEKTQGINRITMQKPPSLESKTYAGEAPSHFSDGGSLKSETPDVSPSETLYNQKTIIPYRSKLQASEFYAFLQALLGATRSVQRDPGYYSDLEHEWHHDPYAAIATMQNTASYEFTDEQAELITSSSFKDFFLQDDWLSSYSVKRG